jgi:hypothetical protein
MPPPASGLPRLPNQGHPPLIPVLFPSSFLSILRSLSSQVSGLFAIPKPYRLIRLSPPVRLVVIELQKQGAHPNKPSSNSKSVKDLRDGFLL